jgi:hypothetical protein
VSFPDDPRRLRLDRLTLASSSPQGDERFGTLESNAVTQRREPCPSEVEIPENLSLSVAAAQSSKPGHKLAHGRVLASSEIGANQPLKALYIVEVRRRRFPWPSLPPGRIGRCPDRFLSHFQRQCQVRVQPGAPLGDFYNLTHRVIEN